MYEGILAYEKMTGQAIHMHKEVVMPRLRMRRWCVGVFMCLCVCVCRLLQLLNDK